MSSSADNRVTYTGDGTTTTFAVPFEFLADGDLVVVKRTAAAYGGAVTYVPSYIVPLPDGILSNYIVGDVVRGVHPNYTDHIYECTVAGLAYITTPGVWQWTPTGTGAAILTGATLTWKFVTTDSGPGTQALSSNYTVLGAGFASGGSVTFLADFIPTSAEEIIIYNDPSLTQLVDYVSGDAFPAETHERSLDRVTIQQKRTREIAARALGLPDADVDGAGAYDATQNRIKNLGAPTLVGDAATKTYVDTAVTNAAFSAPTGIVATGSSEPRDLADRWAQQYNVKDFGADSTGLINATADIQEALDACDTAGGGTVYFPKGRYLVSEGDTANTALLVYDDTRIVCDHDAWIITATADISIFRNADFGSFAEPGGWTGGNSNIEMDHVNVDSTGVTSGWVGTGSPKHGVFQFQNVSGLSIHHCNIIKASKHAIRMRHNDNFDISHNEIEGSGTVQKSCSLGAHPDITSTSHDIQYGNAINAAGDHTGVIIGNRFIRTWGATIVMFSNYGDEGPEVYDIVIANNYIEGSEDNGIRLEPSGNAVDAEEWYDGPYNPETLYNIHIVNNTIKDVIGHYIRAQGNQLVVSGNVLVKDVMWDRGADPHTAILTGSTWPYLQKLDVGAAGVGIAISTGGDDVVCTGNIIRTNTSVENGKIQGPAFDTGITVRVDQVNYTGAKRSKIVISDNIVDGCRYGISISGGSSVGLEVVEDVTISGNVVSLDPNSVDSATAWDSGTNYFVGNVVKSSVVGSTTNRYVCTADIGSGVRVEPAGYGTELDPVPDPPTGWSHGPLADGNGFWELLSSGEVERCIRVAGHSRRISITGNNCSYGEHGIEVTSAGGTFVDETCVTNGTTTVTMTSTAAIGEGLWVSGTDIPDGAYVASVTNETTFTLSAAATGSTDPVTLTFYKNGSDNIISGNTCWNNGQEAGDGFGIILSDQDNFVVTGNRCLDSQTSKTQELGLRFYTSPGHNRDCSGIISSNNLSGNIQSVGLSAGGDGMTGSIQCFGNLPPDGLSSFGVGVGGSYVKTHLSATATLVFGDIAAQAHEDQTMTVTGAAVGDTVALGIPHAVATGAAANDISFTAWVSSSNTVTVRCVNADTLATGNLPDETFRADVWSHN